ncbi:MAG: permease [Deltaproteobacteria bacterium]|nr:permease [Deltaproteobacteria bacterium]MBI2974418.1 permease [Deltaproteobacteria bacterium]
MIIIIIDTLKDALLFVLSVLYDDSVYLSLGILIAVAIKTYVDFDKLKHFFSRSSGVSIFSSVAFGAFTPFCACGTMAITLSMLASALPWGPIMAFLTSSALMCPSTFVLYSGVVGLGFAIAVTLSSVFIGIGSGYATTLIERRTGVFKNQLRFSKQENVKANCCGHSDVLKYYGLDKYRESLFKKLRLAQFASGFYQIGVKIILPYFCLFAFLSFFVERFVPNEWIVAAFGAKHFYSVPIAAIVGLPLYVGSTAALPLIQTLMKAGASPGSLLAFLITGPGTSIAVMAGLGIIIKRRAVAMYLLFILAGAVISGYVYDLCLYAQK